MHPPIYVGVCNYPKHLTGPDVSGVRRLVSVTYFKSIGVPGL